MDLILRNARQIGAEHELTDIGIAAGRIAVIAPDLAAEGETIDLGGRLVSPGFVDTPWWAGLPEEAREAYFAQAAGALLTRRIATADDVAGAVVFAATNPNVTGTVIETDGGARLVSFG